MEKAALASQISSFAIQEHGGDDAYAKLAQDKKMMRIKAELQR
jgi:hypothetical protein